MRPLGRVAGIAAMCVALAACRTGAANDAACRDTEALTQPSSVAEAFASALEKNRLDEAFALLEPSERGERAAFDARYASAEARNTRAAEIRASLPALRVSSPSVALVQRDGWKIVDASPGDARDTLDAFLTAAEQKDFSRAYGLLSGSWRAQYTADRLRQDFESEPLAKERLVRARSALSAPVQLQGDTALFPIGEGKAVKLVREGGAFRVAALE